VLSLGYDNEKFCALFSYLLKTLYKIDVDENTIYSLILEVFDTNSKNRVEEIVGGMRNLTLHVIAVICNFIYLLFMIDNFKHAGNTFLEELNAGPTASAFKNSYSMLQKIASSDNCYLDNMSRKMTHEEKLAYLFKPEVVTTSKELITMIKCFHDKPPLKIINTVLKSQFLESFDDSNSSPNTTPTNNNSDKMLVKTHNLQIVPMDNNMVLSYHNEITQNEKFKNFQVQLYNIEQDFLKTLDYDNLQENLKKYRNKKELAKSILDDNYYTEYLYEIDEKENESGQLKVNVIKEDYAEIVNFIGNIAANFAANTITNTAEYLTGRNFKHPISSIIDNYFDQITRMMDSIEDKQTQIRRLIRDSMNEIVRKKQPILRCMDNYVNLLNRSGFFISNVSILLIHLATFIFKKFTKKNKTKKTNLLKNSPENTAESPQRMSSPMMIEQPKIKFTLKTTRKIKPVFSQDEEPEYMPNIQRDLRN
jgi:hypothetical protein